MDGAGPQIELARRVAEAGVGDRRVLAAIAAVARAPFLAPDLRPFADEDTPLPIGHGQTTSRPYVIAAMLEALVLEGAERVLEVGTGCGYQTALLCALLPAPALVRSLEVREELHAAAAAALREAGCTNFALRLGDGRAGWPEAAPFDAIVVSAAPEQVPPALLAQLAPGGRMVLPVGPDGGFQVLELWRRSSDGELTRRELMDVRFVPLVGARPAGIS